MHILPDYLNCDKLVRFYGIPEHLTVTSVVKRSSNWVDDSLVGLDLF